MQDLREATITNVKVGPFLDKTDAYTPKTALSPVVKLSKVGGTFATRNSATATAHDTDGFYTVELNATDTNTRGRMRLSVSDATALPVWEDINVLSQAVYDEKFGGALLLQAATVSTVTLDSGANANDSYYNDQFITIVSGPGVEQTRRVLSYVGATKIATLDKNWVTTPTSASVYRFSSNASAILLPTQNVTLTAGERNSIADAQFDRADAIETALTLRQALRLIAAESAGKLSGASAGAGTVLIRNAVADTKVRITALNDTFGNRTSVSTDVT